jgi:hypothetical protein
MGLTLQQIQENCAKARKSMARARAEHFAFGARLKTVAKAAAAKNAPILVEVGQGEVDDIGLANVRNLRRQL